ncbi:expressed unknown protein [Seminavis robusta]|uniref:Uncharacterized protein n=1 Tax=Seminavis robusta TaxID=568900 RepID=A0A9N8DPH4_9STRA|nr:expressed unknown protein [Seminavis robusta]|eukprot:Sro277_g106330.1 n/a (159) ;mRNA; r:46406-46882
MVLNPRYGRFGRRVDWLAIVMYSLMNGVLETFAFLFAYDLGRHLDVESLFGWHNKNDELIGFLIGFSIYYVYAGLIHIVVWMRMVFPQHVLHESALPFHTHCLPFLTLQSIAWLVLYEATNDVFFICLCHCITDMGHAWTCAMPYTTWNANGAFLLRE